MDTRRHRTIAIVTLLVLVADLGTKRWAEAALADGPVDLGWITLRLAQNPGIAFSLGADGPAWVVVAVTVLATVVIGTMAWRGTLRPAGAAGLLLGGGLGNLIDRFVGGSVTDFLDLGWFPSFNVADMALNVGVIVVIVVGLLTERREAAREVDDHDGLGETVETG